MAHVKEVLTSNMPRISLFLQLLPDEGELPSLKQLAVPVTLRRQQRLQAIGKSLSLSVEPSETDKILMKLHDRVKILAQHGVGPKLRVLMLVTLHETMILLDFDSKQSGAASVTAGAASSFTACIDHILPGVLDGLLEHDNEDLTSVDALLRMVPPLERALESYRDRAKAANISLAQVVMLEAAVQGWPRCAPHCTFLPHLILTALAPGIATIRLPLMDSTPPAALVASRSTQVTPEQGRMPRRLAVVCLEACPSDVLTIFKEMLGTLDLTKEDPLLGKTLIEQEDRPKSPLTELFAGIGEELFCAVNSENVDMCPALISAAARHIWKFEAHEDGVSITQYVQKKVKDLGFKAGELPAHVGRAINDICARMQVDKSLVGFRDLHRDFLKAMHRKLCKGTTVQVWILKALAQLAELRINHHIAGTVVKAGDALLPGVVFIMLDPLVSKEQEINIAVTAIETAVLKAAIAATDLKRGLKAHLYDLAGYAGPRRGACHHDVTHLIAILADRIAVGMSETAACQETQREAWSRAWSPLDAHSPDMVLVMMSAYIVPVFPGRAAYATLQKELPGMPELEVFHAISKSELARAAKLVEQQIKAKRMHINMCIKTVMRGRTEGLNLSILALLEKFMSICAEDDVSSPRMKAVTQALPVLFYGMLECLSRLHRWPHGLDKGAKWLTQATQLVRNITAQLARDAGRLGRRPERHIHIVLTVPGLHAVDAELLAELFKDFWPALSREVNAAASGLTAKPSMEATSRSPSSTSAASSASAGEQPSAAQAATGSNRKAGQAQKLSQQGSDGAANAAADVMEGASGSIVESVSPGQSEPGQDAQEAAKPRAGLSEAKKAQKAEKRKAKKARQLAAKAQAHAAAQTAEVEGVVATEPGPTEAKGSTSKAGKLSSRSGCRKAAIGGPEH
ncbi:g10049 [Coccomyxa viridis]|uniref:G10049 protein n=1 Tax=Coccomyxa viridis TaxID=1274662 RepID=A0ABP1GAJ4_9CHLO